MLLIAAALLQSTTTCTTYVPNQVNCTTQSQRNDMFGDFLKNYQQSSRAATDAQMEAIRRSQRQSEKEAAAHMIINGDCPGAERYALGKGNIALAQEVKDYCAR